MKTTIYIFISFISYQGLLPCTKKNGDTVTWENRNFNFFL